MRWLSFCLFFFCSFVYSQEYVVRGNVRDSNTGEYLAFVNIMINNSSEGGMTDIDGQFNIPSSEPIKFLKLSYVGYYSTEIPVQPNKVINVKLEQQNITLPEISIIAGENPAHRIIGNVLAHKHLNDPKLIKSFSYTSYDKMIFTLSKDSAINSEVIVDSIDIALSEIMEKQHLFMMESVSEHKYLSPDRSHDKVIATKMSGLKDPLFIFLLSQFQPTSFYESVIDLAGKKYINPIGYGFDKLYFFHLSDTLFNTPKGDTTFIISFKPAKGRNFDALTGLLYINTCNWAITHVIAEPSKPEESVTIKIQQMYEFLDNKQWFPVHLNTEITFNNLEAGSGKPVGIGKSYRSNIILEPELVKKQFDNISVEVLPDAVNRDEYYWNQYRSDSLSGKEVYTYRMIDSLGKANNLEAKSNLLTSLLLGRIPIGKVDLAIDKLFRFNAYEKTYLGLGLSTNNRLSRSYSLGGFAGYGFGDKTTKYGGSLQLNLMKYNALKLKIKYTSDIEETARVTFFDDDQVPFTTLNLRNFYIANFEMSETKEALIHFTLLKYVTAAAGVRQSQKRALYNYNYLEQQGDVLISGKDHNFGYFVGGLRFAFKEKFVRNIHEQISLGTIYPVLWVQYTGSYIGLFNGNYKYNRLDLKLKYSTYQRLAGQTTFNLAGGFIDNDAPLSELINGRGSAGAAFSVFAPNSFTTMKPLEFIHDRYAALFVTHNFGKLLVRTKLFEPEIALVINMGIGSMKKPENHEVIEFKTMEKGYYETGVVINNIVKTSLSGIGVGTFYRFGPNSYNKELMNLMLRISFSYSF